MQQLVLVLHIMLAAALIALVLLQRSEGGALGIGGGGGGLLSSRGKATTLTRATTTLGILFFVTSMTLAVLARQDSVTRSVIDAAPVERNAVSGQPAAPAEPGDSPPEAPLVEPEAGPRAGAPAVPTGE